MRISDVVIGTAFVLASVGYFIASAALPVSPSLGDSGPAHLPEIIAVVTGIAGIALAIVGLRPASGKGKPIVFPPRPVLLAVASVVAVILMPIIGTPVTLALFVFGGVLIQTGRVGLIQGAISAVLITALVYGLFSILLDVPLP